MVKISLLEHRKNCTRDLLNHLSSRPKEDDFVIAHIDSLFYHASSRRTDELHYYVGFDQFPGVIGAESDFLKLVEEMTYLLDQTLCSFLKDKLTIPPPAIPETSYLWIKVTDRVLATKVLYKLYKQHTKGM